MATHTNSMVLNCTMNQSGYLKLILGPMFSGKTSLIVEEYKKYTFIGKRVCVINYFADTRYDMSMLSTHDKVMIPCIMSQTISDLWSNCENSQYNNIRNADVILINEGQFFGDLYECVLDMVEAHNKIVYICGLDGDFMRNRFGKILDLIPYCDQVVKLNSLCSVCRDGTKAAFSHRISRESGQIVIGGADSYVALCRKCYILSTCEVPSSDITDE